MLLGSVWDTLYVSLDRSSQRLRLATFVDRVTVRDLRQWQAARKPATVVTSGRRKDAALPAPQAASRCS